MKRAISLTGFVAVAALALVAQVAVACGNGTAATAGPGGGHETGSGVRGHGAVATAVALQQTQTTQSNVFRWRGALAAGRVIEVRGVNGRVEAEPASGGEVEVVAEKSARRSNPEEVRIEVVEHGEGVTICAVYPNRDGDRPNTCERGGGRNNVRNNDVVVDFKVRVPAGVRFHGSTVNGDVEAARLGADVDAHTVNGSIEISTTGLARAKTVNGSITAVMGRADWQNELEFKTVNGTIDLSFPADLSAAVDVETVNGEITSDFPLTVVGRFSKRHLEGTIGGGGRELRLKTVNGSVQIRRAS